MGDHNQESTPDSVDDLFEPMLGDFSDEVLDDLALGVCRVEPTQHVVVLASAVSHAPSSVSKNSGYAKNWATTIWS